MTSQPFPSIATLALEGHLIDSLTLAKVIDTIQSLGGDYRLNHLSIGSQKNELSSVILTLLATDDTKRSEILEAIQPYGAKPLSTQDAVLTACTQTKEAPPHSILPFPLPSYIRVNGAWLPVNTQGMQLVITVDPQTQKAQLKHISELKPGEQVANGFQGIQWDVSQPLEETEGAPCQI